MTRGHNIVADGCSLSRSIQPPSIPHALHTHTKCIYSIRFPTFQLDHHGPTDRPTNGRTDKASYRVACPQLKRNREMCLSKTAFHLRHPKSQIPNPKFPKFKLSVCPVVNPSTSTSVMTFVNLKGCLCLFIHSTGLLSSIINCHISYRTEKSQDVGVFHT